MNQTTNPAACPDSDRVERSQLSHGRAIRVVSVNPKNGGQTAEEKLRVLAALELQRKKSASGLDFSLRLEYCVLTML